MLDPEKERERLATQISRVTKQLESSRRNLANEQFVGKAPAHVVEAERSKATDLESQIALLSQNLEALSGP